ncbi:MULTISPECIES: cell division endopeptidase DipM [Brucella/Ochrobactrum group]|uniref:Membrane proteins related to metalloendopeptidases n=1 Tax=Ochrobactrum soli TaxID=2448455 RepID=A0A2P9HM37_9HYPH|nr:MULTISPECIES: cell division endopeptidase DipM [Brucella]MCI0999730.1 peptidoglycan DD-metalloendopeptidase family protein [Ochrobactrum sp. C6C9]MDX4072320.1 cell division endopeptidase DipM [Brucella sp. NBRC 113783]SPL65174.1 Membrane proteins related to metalloendopeptidases [[Ochrobactrum] soli]
MDELNMRFPILHHTSERLLRNVAIVLIAGFGAGCSSDTMRFTDGIFTGSTSNQRVAQQPAGDVYASAPIAPAPRLSSGTVQRNSLPAPSAVSSAPMAAPVAAARQSVQAPVAAASTQMQNQVGQARDMAANQVNGAETRVASAATTTHNAVNGTKEKVLGQLPATPGQGAPRPTDNNIAVVPAVPSVNGKKSAAATDLASAGANTATPPAPKGGYTVQSGDSLFSIAQKHNVPVDDLKKANGLSNGAIRVGQTLVIPAAGAAAVTQVAAVTPQPASPAKAVAAAPETAGSVKPYTPPQASNKVIEDAEKDQAAAPSSTGISQMRWPVRGRILASFGQREGTAVSDGIDIMVPEGTSVKAAENGVVIYAGDGLKEFGQTVLIRHDNGLVTVYGHNSQILVQRGQKVRRGEDIAKSGMSGNAKSPKLHFEVRKNSSPVNPSKYLES